jgi:hypothetical protein
MKFAMQTWLKAWSLVNEAIWEVLDTLAGGTYLEEVSHLEMSLEARLCHDPFLSLSFLFPGCQEVSSFAPPGPSTMM